MPRKQAIVRFLLIAGLGLFVSAQTPVDVSGDWQLKVEASGGERVWKLSIVQNGQELKVKMTGPQGKVFEGQGKITEVNIEWSVVRPTARGDKTFVYKGTVEENTMKGEILIDNASGAKWTATR
jgi:hypothetical protein